MGEYSVARVVVDSPLLSLDKPFDFSIPANLQDDIQVGSLVRVTLGRSSKQYDAYVVELLQSSEFKLKPLLAASGPIRFLPPSSYDLLRQVADRSACAIGDLFAASIPTRMVRSESTFAQADWQPYSQLADGKRTTQLSRFWIKAMVQRAIEQKQAGLSSLLITPDYRDHALLTENLRDAGLSFIDYSTTQTKSARYQAFIESQTVGTHIVVGNRASIYAPIQNLGLIAIFDESDDSYTEQTAPYLSVREIALIRQNLTNCNLHFVAPTRSTDVQRLVEIGYLADVSEVEPRPQVAYDSENSRNSAMAFSAIRESVANGSVLVQVPSRGVAKSCYCSQCSTRAICLECAGPLWIDSSNVPRCRWCNRQNLDFRCRECGSANLRQGLGGVTRTVTEMGKAFPGVNIIESSGDKPVQKLKAGKRIVLATPGAEPHVEGGYAAVVILDAGASLHVDSLRATEHAVRKWVNTISLLSTPGRMVFAGVPPELGQRLALWQLVEIAKTELAERRELDFPPHLRLASIQGDIELCNQICSELKRQFPQIVVLGPIQVRNQQRIENRFVVKFNYADGHALAVALRALLLASTAGVTQTSTGKNQRAIKVRMDDPEVI